MQKDFLEFLLFDLRPRSGMYLTAYKISYLDIFLSGVQTTCWELDKSGAYSERFFGDNGFLQWSWNKYNLSQPPYRLHHYLEFAVGDEKTALNLFFDDLEAYHSERSH